MCSRERRRAPRSQARAVDVATRRRRGSVSSRARKSVSRLSASSACASARPRELQLLAVVRAEIAGSAAPTAGSPASTMSCEVVDVAERLRHLLGACARPPRSSGARRAPRSARTAAASRLRACAISFSWCGKIRSTPPPWMSIGSSPSSRSAIAEHSMCQPGRPGRQPGLPRRLARLRRLPQHEVARVLLVVLVGVDARAALDAAVIEPRELAVLGKRRDLEVDRPVARVGVAVLLERLDHAGHRRRCGRSRAARSSTGSRPSAAASSRTPRRTAPCTRAAAARPSPTRRSCGRRRR